MNKLGFLTCVFLITPQCASAQCVADEAADHSLVVPTVTTETIDRTTKWISGKLPVPTQNVKVLLCIDRNKKLLADAGHVVTEDGSFSIGVSDLQPEDKVTLEVVTPGGNVGPPSKAITFAKEDPVDGTGDFTYSLIAGVEESSFSSIGLNTNPFLQAYMEGARNGPLRGFSGWGRIRMLGAPQASTNGIGSSFLDPTGTLTKQDFTKVGTSLDVVGGAVFTAKKTSNSGRIDVIGGIGWTTPLSSQDVAYVFKVPDAGTLECQELRSRFTPATGYDPGLTPDQSNKSCLINSGSAVKDISFANQDRSNFLLKWGAGFRLVGSDSPKGTVSMLDVAIGQDAVVTGGYVRHYVLKEDGVLSVSKLGDLVYIYGSLYTRFTRNRDVAPLILAAESNKPTGPSADVVVLPLKQPDRDFFRLGVGINLDKLGKAVAAAAKK